MAQFKIIIDKELCISCGSCTMTAPEIFELGADSKAQVKADAIIDPDLLAKAAKECVMKAISFSKVE
jgi:ferredoxin